MTNWNLYGHEIPPEAKRCVFIHPDTPLPDCADDITVIRTDLVKVGHYIKTDDVEVYQSEHIGVRNENWRSFSNSYFNVISITAFK